MDSAIVLCNNQILALYRDLDESKYEPMVARFAPDGVWHRQGKVLEGRDQMLAALQMRSKTQRVHHLMVNLFADRVEADRCSIRGYMLVLRHEDGKPIEGPAPLTGIESIRTTYIDLARIDGQWLITQMRGDAPTFSSK